MKKVSVSKFYFNDRDYNISLVVELQRFLAKNQHTYLLKGKNPSMNYGSSKSAKIILSKTIIDGKNQWNFFHIRILIEETIFCKKHYFVKVASFQKVLFIF